MNFKYIQVEWTFFQSYLLIIEEKVQGTKKGSTPHKSVFHFSYYVPKRQK